MKASLGQEAFASALALEFDIGLLDAGADGPNGAGAGDEVRLSQPVPSPEGRLCMDTLLGDDGVHGEDRGPDPLRWFGYWFWRSNCCCCW